MNSRTIFFLSLVAFLALGLLASPSSAQEWKAPTPGYQWSFPRDHANHGDYPVEWWYYTGHLLPVGADSTNPDAWVHLQLTFFRSAAGGPEIHPLYFAHLAMSGGATGDFDFAERIARGTLGEAGSDQPVYHVWLDNWSAFLAGDKHVLEAYDPKVGGFRLVVTPEIKPVLNGVNGYDLKHEEAGIASYYYSVPRMAATGYLLLPEDRDGSTSTPSASTDRPRTSSPSERSLSSHPERSEGSMFSSVNESDSSPTAVAVTGHLWMDHEFGNQGTGAKSSGWDWWGLPLPGGEALMIYQIHGEDGKPTPQSEGTFVHKDGSSERVLLSDFTVTPTGEWTSPASGITYPHGWTISVPRLKLVLTVTPVRDNQELRTDRSTRITYYEGAVTVQRKGYKASSYGFVELVGYKNNVTRD